MATSVEPDILIIDEELSVGDGSFARKSFDPIMALKQAGGTFLFLVAFMYLGRYRAHLVIWLASIIGTLFVAIIFLKVVYVSLPRGVPPFDRVTDAFMNLF